MKNVLYIHGAYASPSSFNHLHRSLPDHRAVFASYDCLEASVETIVETLATKAHREFTGEPYSVVAHSMGGLIAVGLLGRGEPVERIVTMSTPFGGSRLANLLQVFFFHLPVFRDIAPYGRTIRAIQQIAITIPMLSLVTTGGGTPLMSEANDGVVTVASQTALSGPAYQPLPYNHFEVLLAPETVAAVSGELFAV